MTKEEKVTYVHKCVTEFKNFVVGTEYWFSIGLEGEIIASDGTIVTEKELDDNFEIVK